MATNEKHRDSFKVGDRVRDRRSGWTGEIVRAPRPDTHGSAWTVKVRWDRSGSTGATPVNHVEKF